MESLDQKLTETLYLNLEQIHKFEREIQELVTYVITFDSITWDSGGTRYHSP